VSRKKSEKRGKSYMGNEGINRFPKRLRKEGKFLSGVSGRLRCANFWQKRGRREKGRKFSEE